MSLTYSYEHLKVAGGISNVKMRSSTSKGKMKIIVIDPSNNKMRVDLHRGKTEMSDLKAKLKSKYSENINAAIFYQEDDEGQMVELFDCVQLTDGIKIYMAWKTAKYRKSLKPKKKNLSFEKIWKWCKK